MKARAVALTLGLGLLGGRAQAQQYTLVDLTYEHTRQKRVAPAAGAPSNWSTPVDYRGGRVHGHLEILSRPSPDPAVFTICVLESDSPLSHACATSPRYTTARVVDWSLPFSGLWNDGTVTWTRKPISVALIQKNDKNQNIEPGHALAPRYLPAKVRVVLTFVAAGATYRPPGPAADGGASGPPDARSPDAAPADALRADLASTSADTAVAAEPPAPTPVDAAVADLPKRPAPSPTTAPAPTDEPPPPAASSNVGGCSVTRSSQAVPPGVLVVITLLGLAWRRTGPSARSSASSSRPARFFGRE